MAANEARFREANDAIEAHAHSLGIDDSIPFVCECADRRCTEIIRLSRSEYLAVRTDPHHFAVAPGHERVSGASAITIGQRPQYSVVRKVGVAGDVAEALDRTPQPELD
jgi:hypothetical protein